MPKTYTAVIAAVLGALALGYATRNGCDDVGRIVSNQGTVMNVGYQNGSFKGLGKAITGSAHDLTQRNLPRNHPTYIRGMYLDPALEKSIEADTRKAFRNIREDFQDDYEDTKNAVQR